MFCPRPHLCSCHVSMVQMIAPRSMVDRSFRTPPTVLPLTEGGGGGPESLIRPARIWTAQDRARKSTINVGFWTPPSILPLMEGGGPECVIKSVHRSAAQRQARRSMAQDVFRTPPTDLLLTGGGGGGPEWYYSSGGSLVIRGSDLMAPSPIISCYLTDLVTSGRHLPPFPKWSCPITAVSPSPPFARGKPLTMTFTSNR
jgi:hypothetical protein